MKRRTAKDEKTVRLAAKELEWNDLLDGGLCELSDLMIIRSKKKLS
jgi:hypothetical protein